MAEMKATRVAYGDALVELGAQNDKVVVLDADLAHATMTMQFQQAYPERFFNIGIAESNLVGMGAGLSTMGYVPFCSTFAIFGTGRAYEIVRNAVAYPHFNVKLAMTHAGITVGEDGGSHQSIEDIALMRVIPGMTVINPADYNETRRAIFAAAELDGPVYIRLARAASPVFEGDDDKPFTLGKANVLREGDDIAVVACGYMVHIALQAADTLAAEGKRVAVINMHTIKPLDAETVLTYADRCKNVVTLEEHSVIGGLGEAVAAELCGRDVRFHRIGVQDRFGQSGKYQDMLEEYGLSAERVTAKIRELI